MYNTAQQIDVDDLLRCSPEIREQYARIMNTWRKVHVSLDGVTSASSESDQEAALERISALLAPYPAGKPNKLQRPFGALAGWCAPITRASNGRPVFSLGKLPRRLNALGDGALVAALVSGLLS